MADPFYGEIRAFAFTYAPMDWATCDGQVMPISQNPALASILGATYGGNGTTTFGLPNLQGRAPMNFGAGPGLTSRSLGEVDGVATVPLGADNIPPHTHALNAVSNSIANQTTVAGHYLSQGGNPGRVFQAVNSYQQSPSANTHLAADAVLPAGTAVAPINHDNMQPYLPVLMCIALYGEWPEKP
jgi:microcystin-dependent protein